MQSITFENRTYEVEKNYKSKKLKEFTDKIIQEVLRVYPNASEKKLFWTIKKHLKPCDADAVEAFYMKMQTLSNQGYDKTPAHAFYRLTNLP